MFRSPTRAGLPGLSVMLNDLPATLPQVARHLGLSLATLRRYCKADQAPRCVMLALFWETRFGMSIADCDAANYSRLQKLRADGLLCENRALSRKLDILERELSFGRIGAANSPVWRLG